ncbi:helix-turn-helix domain-containing protein [Streptomyces sp. NPDC013953]|uniref:AraC-like ligand-binding domain-containing protein n=1 Tax=Streptomyces sp. NPDC013953 TaxID=3364868 RepID=UPI0036F9809B
MESSVAPASGTPRGGGFEWFCETVSSDLMPVSISTRHTADFRAEITDLDLGGPRLSAFAFSPVVSRRTPAHVRRGDPEQFQLALITRGVFRVSQRGHESEVSHGLVLTDTSRPMENETTAAGGGPAEAVVLQIPRPALPLRPDRLDRLLAQGMRADRGSAAVFAGFLKTLLGHAPHCRPDELRTMGSVALDLATTCLAQQLGDPGEAPAEARAQEMLRRILCHIDHNLGDPDLTPRVVADRHGISLRALYALFRDQPMSVAARIRRGRLERAHADLARREASGLPVQVVAARWGFSSATAFSRAFRETYGTTPTEHRAAALARGAQEPCTPRTAAPSPRA